MKKLSLLHLCFLLLNCSGFRLSLAGGNLRLIRILANKEITTPLKLFNSLTHTKHPILPKNPPEISFYSCGPTIYDRAHIGNFRAFLTFDILKRWLTYLGFKVNHVCNLTDIDDKILEQLQKTGLSFKDLTNKYAQHFFDDLKSLNVIPALAYPRASDHIQEAIEMIDDMLKKKVAYLDNGSVYFDVRKAPNYDRFGRCGMRHLNGSMNLESLDLLKDFVLWKGHKASDGEMKWETPFGVTGRPGWHMECSAMIKAYFNHSVDLHAGGADLAFPHHENEMAQSEAVTGEPLCKHWVHNEFVLANDLEKMSKSVGNFLTLPDLCQSLSDLRAFRYIVVTSHYRSPLTINQQSLLAARTALRKLELFDQLVHDLKSSNSSGGASSKELNEIANHCVAQFEKAMNDDLNSPLAMSFVFEFMRSVNKNLFPKNGQPTPDLTHNDVAILKWALSVFNQSLGLFYYKHQDADDIPTEVMMLAEERQRLKELKDWVGADALRHRIRAQGYQITDQHPNSHISYVLSVVELRE